MAYIGTQPKDVRSFGKAKFDYTSTQGQTAFTGADDDNKTLGFTDGQIEVFVNGILMDESDFTTSNGNTVTLASAANLNDVISIVAMQTDIPNSDYVPASGGSFTGAVTHTGAFTSKGIDDNADAIAITIDTSENVLVNAADTDPQNLSASSNSGVAIRSDGRIHAGAWQQRAAAFGRGGTDGEIVTFRKDGTTVGNVGIQSTGFYMDGEPGHAGIRFAGNELSPRDNGADADGVVTLGESDKRWKDLYLSGGAYIGGTVAANYLDDYEEGTFNMTVAGYYSNPSSTQTVYGYYTKIGNSVHIFCRGTVNTTGASGHMWLTGLPFASMTPYTVLSCTMDHMGTYPNSSPMAYLAGSIAYIDKHVNQGARTAVFHNAVTNGVITLTGSYRI